MDGRQLVAAVGGAVATLLLVGAVVIEELSAGTGADIAPGIIGAVVGILAGIVALVAVVARWGRVGQTGRQLLLGYAAFGLAFLALSAFSYVDVPGARQYLSVPLNAATAAIVAVAAAAGLRLGAGR